MSRVELLVVSASLADDATRGFVERLALRYLVEVARAGAENDSDVGSHVEVRRFAAAAGAAIQGAGGVLAEKLARARERGPWSPELLEFLHHEHARYRAVVFLSYASPLTAFGLPLVPERAVLVPLVDRDADLGEPPYRALFHLPRAIGYRDAAERDRVHAAVRNQQVPYELLPIGGADDTDRAFDRLVATALYA